MKKSVKKVGICVTAFVIVNLQAKCHFFLSKIGISSTLKTLKIP